MELHFQMDAKSRRLPRQTTSTALVVDAKIVLLLGVGILLLIYQQFGFERDETLS